MDRGLTEDEFRELFLHMYGDDLEVIGGQYASKILRDILPGDFLQAYPDQDWQVNGDLGIEYQVILEPPRGILEVRWDQQWSRDFEGADGLCEAMWELYQSL